MRYFTNLFLKTEDRARKYFEKYPFTHAFLAGVGVIFFWRGAWEVADLLGLGPISSIVLGCLLLGGAGLFVQTFVGNAIIIKSVEKEKELGQKAKKDISKVQMEVKEEEITLTELKNKLQTIETKLDSLVKR